MSPLCFDCFIHAGVERCEPKNEDALFKSLFVLLGMMIEKRNASDVFTVYIGYRKSLLFIIHCALKAINALLTKKKSNIPMHSYIRYS